jgi:hypothetical protein
MTPLLFIGGASRLKVRKMAALGELAKNKRKYLVVVRKTGLF